MADTRLAHSQFLQSTIPNGLRLTSEPLKLQILENAMATPFAYDRNLGKITGCLYDQRGGRVDLSVRTSGVGGDRVTNDDPQCWPNSALPSTFLEGESIYLGHLMGHYGHFITETISTFWALKDASYRSFVFHPFIFGTKILPFMDEMLSAFQIEVDSINLIREPTLFKRIAVPERTFHLNSSIHAAFRDIPREILRRLLGKGLSTPFRKLFVSRSKLPVTEREILNASEVDELMSRNGFEIIHPQQLGAKQQLKIYSEAAVLAGFSGSALHNCIFQAPAATLIEFGDLRSPRKPLLTQVLCNLSSEVKAYHVPYVSMHLGEKKAINLSQLEESINAICSAIKSH